MSKLSIIQIKKNSSKFKKSKYFVSSTAKFPSCFIYAKIKIKHIYDHVIMNNVPKNILIFCTIIKY